MTTTIQTTTRDERLSRETFLPRADVIERADGWDLMIDLPGVAADGLEIDLESGVLSIRGRAEARAPADVRFLLREYGVGDYYRSFTLGDAVDQGAIRATHENGVLTVHLPKSQSLKPRRIEVAAS